MNDIEITRLGLKGDGIAEGPVYAPRTLPGERIAGDVVDGRIEAPRILTPSADRVRPACPHYKSCGGCNLMHASDAFVAGWKQRVVVEALANHGIEAPEVTLVTSPPESRRRATLAGRRLKSGPVVGFHAARSDTVTPVPDCHVLTPDIRAALPAMAEITALAGSRRGTLSFAVTHTPQGLDCAVSGGPGLDGKLAQTLPRFAADFVRLTWNGELVFADRAPALPLGKAEVEIPPGAFLQATEAGQEALSTAVLRALGDATRVVDLFAGCGTFTFPAAERAAVHAVEGEARLTGALEKAVRNTQGLKPVTAETRDLFRRPLDVAELAGFDAAIIDPPRAGAEAQVAMLGQSGMARIAMVSCNPISFARDMKTLAAAGYRMDWLQVVDQFRWSTHVELAAALRLAS